MQVYSYLFPLLLFGLEMCATMPTSPPDSSPSSTIKPIVVPHAPQLSSSKQTKTTQCPSNWVQALLFPCHCDPRQPRQLRCTGPFVNDRSLKTMENGFRYMFTMLNKKNHAELLAALSQFDSLIIQNTLLTRLHTPVFKLFRVRNVTLELNDLLRQVHVSSFRQPMHLDNFKLTKMKNVDIIE